MTVCICKECGESFLSKKKSKYCSSKCRSRAYYRDNPEKCKYLTREWEKNNPERTRARKTAYYNRKNKKS